MCVSVCVCVCVCGGSGQAESEEEGKTGGLVGATVCGLELHCRATAVREQ